MKLHPFRCAVIFASCLLTANAAVLITVAPDGLGGTTFNFSQTSVNPLLSVEVVSTSGFRMELPPGMFSPMVLGGPGVTDIAGRVEMLAQFRDGYSGAPYDVVDLVISNTLSYASFGFQQPFAQRLGQTQVQFELFFDVPGVTRISPNALVVGTHSVGSLLFGTVTVNVIPEPSTLSILLLSVAVLAKRRR